VRSNVFFITFVLKTITTAGSVLLLVCLQFTALPTAAQTQDREQIKDRIESQNKKIKEVEKEINQYESQLQDTQNQKNTLESAVQSLDQSIEQIAKRIRRAKNDISTVQSRIRSLQQEITDVQKSLKNNKQSLSNAIKTMHALDSRSLAELFLSAESLSAAWRTSDQLAQIQASLQAKINETQSLKKRLKNKKQTAENKREELDELRSQLASQQDVLDQQQERKQRLLDQTSRQAQEYQQILKEKRAQKEKFESQLQTFEQRLETTVSNAAVPKANEVSFDWPVPSVNITQQFGGTAFAERNPDAYGRPFHNGTDFGVPVGTPIQAVHAGTVQATGNTDRISGCYSYGKWVLINHENGLSTLYAHLSSINVSKGDSVSNDSIVGYSGNTGYSTGPHLHLTTYVSGDVRIRRLGDIKDETNCGPAAIPVAPQAGYLNSMKFLP
jgi:murein DD-endopeptidase MepM/ murein hydrolase activator NlpD